MLDLPDVRKLRVLREVAARGTIAAAAEAMRMTPSAASQQLASLERQAGVDLVVRTGRSVRLTPTAMRLVEHTERVLHHLEAARVDLSTDPHDISGELHLSAFTTAMGAIVAPALPRLREAYPALDIGVISHDTEDALAALTTGTIDLAVIYDYDLLPSPAPVGAALELLLEEPVHLAVPERLAGDGSPLDLDALADERWIAPADGSSCHTFVVRACHQAGFEPVFWALCEDFAAIADLVAAGVGVAMIPELGCRNVPEGVVLRPLRSPDVVRRIHVATRNGNRDHPGVRAIVDALAVAARATERSIRSRPVTA